MTALKPRPPQPGYRTRWPKLALQLLARGPLAWSLFYAAFAVTGLVLAAVLELAADMGAPRSLQLGLYVAVLWPLAAVAATAVSIQAALLNADEARPAWHALVLTAQLLRQKAVGYALRESAFASVFLRRDLVRWH